MRMLPVSRALPPLARAAPLLAAVIVAHAAILLWMWAGSIWDVAPLDPPARSTDLAVAPAPREVPQWPRPAVVRVVRPCCFTCGCRCPGEGDPPPPPPPPLTPPPWIVPPGVLEASRVAGDRTIEPDAATKLELSRSGDPRILAAYRVCVSADGGAPEVLLLKSSRVPASDDKLARTMRDRWRYRPVVVDGRARRACAAVAFVYPPK